MSKPIKAKERLIPKCHPEKKHGAFGLCRNCYAAAWRAENRDKMLDVYRRSRAKHLDARREAARKYRAEHLTQERERQRIQKNAWRAANPGAHDARMRQWYIDNLERAMWTAAKRRAAKRSIDFSITPEDIVIPEACPMLGIRLTRGETALVDGSPSLDRIDSTRGYVPGNVWVISHLANRAKTNLTLSELRRFAEAILRLLPAPEESEMQRTGS